MRFRLFRQQEVIKRTVQPGKVAQLFAGDEIDLFNRAVQRVNPAQLAVVTQEIVEKTRRSLGTLPTACLRNARGGRSQAIEGKLPVIFDELLYSFSLLARDQGIFELLGIEQRRQFRQQRHYFVRRHRKVQEFLALQQLCPRL